VGFGDLSGPAVNSGNIRRNDLLWRNMTNGALSSWIVGPNGLSIEAIGNYGVVLLSWEILR
jgi:hypothetical protein